VTRNPVARFLALLLGCLLTGLILGVGCWVRSRPTPTHEIELRVVDARGQPVERFGWVVLQEAIVHDVFPDRPSETRSEWYPVGHVSDGVWSAGTPQQNHPVGVAFASVPVHRLKIEVRAKGFQPAQLGPFEANALPVRLHVIVPDLGVVEGKVTSEGQTVAGASVMLVMRSADVTPGVPSGLFQGIPDLGASTDQSGFFRIGSEYPQAEYFIRTRKEGFSPKTAGPVHVGDPPMEVQLGQGGSIEVHLHLPDARDPDGVEVELYRTDPDQLDVYGHFIVRADSDGRFGFEHVEPGTWLVRLKPPLGGGGKRTQIHLDYLPFVVGVADRATVRLDMDLSQPPARLEGRMIVDGKPWNAVFVRLHAIGEEALVIDGAPADNQGRWTLRTRAPGRYRIVAWGTHEHALDQNRLTDVVELSRDGVRWEREFGPGEIVPFGER
jgi:hypothetical protein